MRSTGFAGARPAGEPLNLTNTVFEAQAAVGARPAGDPNLTNTVFKAQAAGSAHG